MISGIRFAQDNWLLPVVVAAVVFLLLLIQFYRIAPTDRKKSWLPLLLKYAAVLLLLLCLLDPQLITEKPVKGETVMLIAADRSSSMGRKNPGELQSKGDELNALLNESKSGFQKELSENFDLRNYVFDSALEQKKDLSELSFNGQSSNVNESINELGRRYDKNKTAGILLFTDAIITDDETTVDFDKLPPVYPCILGTEQKLKDIWIEELSASVSSFEDSPVSVKAIVNSSGYENRELTAELFDGDGLRVESMNWENQRSEKTLRFQLKSKKTGIQFYKLRVSASDEMIQFEDPLKSKELTLKNNSRQIKVDRRGGPFKVLYVAGRPNWEYKFLARSVENDHHIQLTGLIRIAKREEKFAFRDRGNSNANPLFQGLDKKNADREENFDEPVFIRLNTAKENDLMKGFPSSKEELYAYHAVIVDDLEAAFFTTDQLTLLRDFVSHRGGGLIVLSGMESLREGGYHKTVLKDALPVYMNSTLRAKSEKPKYQLSLSREGWLQPWVRLSGNEADEKLRLAAMPGFKVLNRVSGVKPGAQVLATVKDEKNNQYPALITQRYGLGRIAVMTVGDFWRWGLKGQDEKKNMEKAWRQMVRWIVADVPRFLEFNARKDIKNSKRIRLSARFRNKKFVPQDNLKIKLTVQGPDNSVISKWLQQDEAESGLYRYDFYPDKEGIYRSTISISKNELTTLVQENAFLYERNNKENQTFNPDLEYMQMLADKTGGKVIEAGALEEFSQSLQKDSQKVNETTYSSIWNRFWVFLLAIGLLTGEWAMRRLKGMP